MPSRVSRELGGRCLSDLRFDALLGDELDGSDRAALLTHLDACAICRDRLSAIAYDRSCFLASELAAPTWLSRLEASQASAPTPWPVFAAIALAACLLLAALYAQRPERRARSEASVSLYVERGAPLAPGRGPEEEMQRGGALRFAYTAERARHLALVGVDTERRVNVYFPRGERSARVEAGVGSLLPVAVALHATPRVEQVYALFCDAPFALSPLRDELAAHGGPPRLAPGCVADALTLRTTSDGK